MSKLSQRNNNQTVRANNPLVRAYHEAGHALVAKSLGWKVQFVSIEADRDGQKFGIPNRWGAIQLARDPTIRMQAHAAHLAAELTTAISDDELMRVYSPLHRAIRKYIQFAMGGMAALSIYERRTGVRFAKDFMYGASEDLQLARSFASCMFEGDEAMHFVKRGLVSAVNRLLRPANWLAVEQIASRLVKQRTLNGDELNAITRAASKC